MTNLRRACLCGATLMQWDEPHRNDLAAMEWDAMHSGEGHGEEDYLIAVQTRTRNEIARVQAQITDNKPGRN